MAVFADGKIEAYVGPPGLGAADDLEAVIVEFIAGARTKLDVAVQELDSEAIARALLAASWRGVRVTLFEVRSLSAGATVRGRQWRTHGTRTGTRRSRHHANANLAASSNEVSSKGTSVRNRSSRAIVGLFSPSISGRATEAPTGVTR